MTISAVSEDYEHLAYQSEDQYTIEFKPITKAESEEQQKDKFGYTGERLSLNFQSIEVRAVLQLIADFTGLNMVTSDAVSGNVTLRLKNVPWDQALDIILKSRGLGMRKDGNVIMVAPSEELAARERLELEVNRQVEELAPLRTEFVQINYADAADLMGLIQASENNLLSERGNVSIDSRTNTLIVQDVSSSLESIRGLISELDVAVRQVLIESRIVNADESFAKDIGVRFGYSKHTKQGTQDRATIGENPANAFGAIGGGNPGNVNYGGTTSFNDGTNENLIVDLPALPTDAASLALAIGKVGSYLLQLELSALIAEGRGEDIASPRVITANQNEAVIESGVQIPYQEASSSGATSTSFQDATLSLRVTPQITPDDRIIMDLEVNQDTVSATVVNGVPAINTRSVTTQVLVQNGETVVLGGVYSSSERKSVDRTPFFGDLPYLGFLFKRTSTDSTKNELLIFITPKILKDSLTI
jgi:type IV pilus assembly protein PilQ